MKKVSDELSYGPVYVTRGPLKGRILYYDDDDDGRKAICYAGHPVDLVGYYVVSARLLREPVIDDLLRRRAEIGRTLTDEVINGKWSMKPARVHELWSEKSLIDAVLHERRTVGEMAHIAGEKSVFLCHSSSDKGFVRMVNDDLCRLGAKTWLDENKIKVGDSLVGKVSDGLKDSQFMIVFLSENSVKSLWTRREWQSFLSRQLAGTTITILPALVQRCEVPAILADLKYADFTHSYYDGLKALHAALAQSTT